MSSLSPSPSHTSPPTPSGADAQSPSLSKRKRLSTTTTTTTTTTSDASPSSSPKRHASYSFSQPPSTVLPPPIIPYPQHPMSAHPHFVPFYPMYPHHPVYIPIPASSSPATSTPNKLGDSPQPNLVSSPIPREPTPPGYYHHPAAAAAAAAANSTPSSSFHNHPPRSPASRPGTADEREQARRVSHSAIERRRRERINDKIIQLRQLIPSCADQDHLNKMTILQSAIDYISHLKKTVENKDGTNSESLKLDNLKIQSPRSMMPKEVTPFTTQFAVNPQPPPTPPSTAEPLTAAAAAAAEEEEESAAPMRGIKPMDIIDARKNERGNTRSGSRPVSASTDEAGPGNMSVDAMLCGE